MTRDTSSPLRFCFETLGVAPYGWQAEAMMAVAMGRQTSVVAANGSGKTARLIAPLILWFLHKHPRGQCIFTSGSWMQIQKQLWPAIRVFQSRFPKWQFMAEELRTPEGGFAFGFSTDNPGRAEGHHPKISPEDDPVFLIIDEAKTVPQSIFEAFDRCTRKYELWVSSPGAPRGPFFDSHHKTAEFFHTVKATSGDCLHIPRERYELDLRRYGADHPLFRSKHLAEFTEDAGAFILTADRLRRAMEVQPVANAAGERVAFCDFAAGGDENVLALRQGNTARIVAAWHEKDTMQGCRQFIRHFESEKLSPGQIWGDADGLGTVMIDALAEQGWRINRFHGGQAATERDEYANLIAECWHVGAREIERGRVHLGQLDAGTFEQLTTRKSEWTETGKLRVESKEKMRAAGIKSPDRADALLGCIACGSRMSGAISASDLMAAPRNDFNGGLVSGF